MNEKEFDAEKDRLENEYTNYLSRLKIRYAISNKVADIGDLIQDHIKMIKCSKITVFNPVYGYPSCVYHGVRIKKNGEEFNTKKIECIYQQSIKSVNGKKI
jgi:hypothetical protein